MKRLLIVVIVLFANLGLIAQKSGPLGLNLIKESDLKKDLYAFADAHFKGRSAGTIDELKASMWLAEKYRSIGLLPAGDDGTYLQFFTMWRNTISDNSFVRIQNKEFKLWKDVSVAQMANLNINAPIVYLGNAVNIDTNKIDVKNKVVAFEASSVGINLNVSLPTWRYNRSVLTKYAMPLIRRGAVAIVILSDDIAEKAWEDANENFKRGTYDIEGGPNAQVNTKVPVLWLHNSEKNTLANGTSNLEANIMVEKYPYPSVNIVGKIEGTDPTLKSEYLLYSGHQDAHGIRNAINNDSTYYGADDNQNSDPTRCGMPINPLLEESSFGCKVLCMGKSSYEMRKIRRYTEWQTMPYKEKAQYDDFQRITIFANNAGISKKIIDDAIRYHKKISEYEQHFRGDNKDGK